MLDTCTRNIYLAVGTSWLCGQRVCSRSGRRSRLGMDSIRSQKTKTRQKYSNKACHHTTYKLEWILKKTWLKGGEFYFISIFLLFCIKITPVIHTNVCVFVCQLKSSIVLLRNDEMLLTLFTNKEAAAQMNLNLFSPSRRRLWSLCKICQLCIGFVSSYHLVNCLQNKSKGQKLKLTYWCPFSCCQAQEQDGYHNWYSNVSMDQMTKCAYTSEIRRRYLKVLTILVLV